MVTAVNATFVIRCRLKFNPRLLATPWVRSKVGLEALNVCLFLVRSPSFVTSEFKAKAHELVCCKVNDHCNLQKVRART